MDTPITFRDAVVQALKKASEYNRNDLVAPVAVLWTDKDRQWERTIPVLKNHLPILTLGEYSPEERIGPAFYIRCMIARTLEEDQIPEEKTPIIYMPGVSKQEIRAIEECPVELQPLAELQYRGVMWVQKNGRDWTVQAFIQTTSGGLGIKMGADQTTKEALQRSLMRLLDEPIQKMREAAPLRDSFFDALLSSDEHRNILLWLDNPNEYPQKVSAAEWQAFCNICKTKYEFDPQKDGPITAAQNLASGKDDWKLVWARFKEAPTNYPGIPELLRRSRPGQLSLEKSEFWPQDNTAAEEQLLGELNALESSDVVSAQNRIIELEKVHGIWREWVWATLREAPLANALSNLANLATFTKQQLAGDDIETIVKAYQEWGWQADAQVIKAIQKVQKQEHIDAVKKVARVIYEPWLRSAAEQFQKVVQTSEYPHIHLAIPQKGTCVFFADALRMDVGQMLAAELRKRGFTSNIEAHLAALPSITATAKPALFDFSDSLTGEGAKHLTPRIQDKKSSLSAQAYRDLLTANGFQILSNGDLGDPSGIAWTEIGAIDVYGHQHGWKIAHHLESEVKIISNRVQTLINYGWQKVLIVTDHGWLFIPGNMPKDELPEHITEMRKGRCAELKTGALTDHMKIPWFWNSHISVAVAPGVSCFEAGKEYEHGGITVQECVTPKITVSKEKQGREGEVLIANLNWRGLRFTANIENASAEMNVDIRLRAGDPESSMSIETATPDEQGNVSILVENDDMIGKEAFVVVTDSRGQLLSQVVTVIGE